MMVEWPLSRPIVIVMLILSWSFMKFSNVKMSLHNFSLKGKIFHCASAIKINMTINSRKVLHNQISDMQKHVVVYDPHIYLEPDDGHNKTMNVHLEIHWTTDLSLSNRRLCSPVFVETNCAGSVVHLHGPLFGSCNLSHTACKGVFRKPHLQPGNRSAEIAFRKFQESTVTNTCSSLEVSPLWPRMAPVWEQLLLLF